MKITTMFIGLNICFIAHLRFLGTNEVMRMVVLKGSGLRDIVSHLGIIMVFALVLNIWAIVNYKKTS